MTKPTDAAPLRALLVCHCCASSGGSEARMSWNWVTALAATGVEVTVLHNGADPTSACGIQNPPRSVTFVDVRGPRIWRRLPVPVYTAVEYWLWQVAARRRARQLHAGRPFDVVHHLSWGSLNYGSFFTGLGPPMVLGPIGGGTRVPSAYRALLPFSWTYERLRNRLVGAVRFNPFARYTVRGAALVLASNQETADLIASCFGRDAEILLDDGVPDDALQTIPVDQLGSGPLRLLWISRMMEFKALELALDAVEVAAKETDVRLTVIGDGPDRQRLAGRLEDLAAGGLIDDRGWCDQDQIDQAFRSHHVLLYTSLRDNGSAPLHEATRWGLPAIVLDHQGPGQITDSRWAIKVPVTDPTTSTDDLADAIESLAHDPGRRLEMGTAALVAGARNTWSARAARMASTYRRLADRRSTG